MNVEQGDHVPEHKASRATVAHPAHTPDGPRPRPIKARLSVSPRVPPPLYALASMVVVQLGMSASKPLFGPLGVAGTTSLRLVIAAILLLAVTRPSLRGKRPREIAAVVLLGVVSGAMTLTYAAAIAHIPMGLASTIEYLGPLTIAVAASRRGWDVLWALIAGSGVALITLSGGLGTTDGVEGLDPLGLGFAAAAAVCWGLYLILTQRVGGTFEGFQGLALSISVGAIAIAPFGLTQGIDGLVHAANPWTWWLLLLAAAGAALLFPVLPYALEMAALRRLPARVLSVLVSLEPAIAALVGFVVLAQTLQSGQMTGIALVICASVAVTLRTNRNAATPRGAHRPSTPC